MKRYWLIFIIVALVLGQAVSTSGQTRQGSRFPRPFKEKREAKQAEQLVDEAAALLKEGKTELAAEKIKRAIQLDADNDRAHAYAAQIAWSEKQFDVAQKHAEWAIRLNPRNARAHFFLGQVLSAEGHALAAFDHLHKAANLASDEKEREEVRKSLYRLRETHPEWFGKAQPAPPLPGAEPPAPQNPPAGARPNLAIFSFEETNPQSEPQDWGESIAEMLTTALINLGRYRLIERKQLSKVLEEQALGQSGVLEAETAVAVGQIMGLDAVVVGSISQLANALETDARILNVETGEAIAATHARGASPDDLRKMAESLAQGIASRADIIPIHSATPDTVAEARQ